MDAAVSLRSILATTLPAAAAIAVFGTLYGAGARAVLGVPLTLASSLIVFSATAPSHRPDRLGMADQALRRFRGPVHLRRRSRRPEERDPVRYPGRRVRPSGGGLHVRNPAQALRATRPAPPGHRGDRARGRPARREIRPRGGRGHRSGRPRPGDDDPRGPRAAGPRHGGLRWPLRRAEETVSRGTLHRAGAPTGAHSDQRPPTSSPYPSSPSTSAAPRVTVSSAACRRSRRVADGDQRCRRWVTKTVIRNRRQDAMRGPARRIER